MGCGNISSDTCCHETMNFLELLDLSLRPTNPSLGPADPSLQSLLMCQSEADPARFASLCGKIDSIANLKHMAKEQSDQQCEVEKQVSCK